MLMKKEYEDMLQSKVKYHTQINEQLSRKVDEMTRIEPKMRQDIMQAEQRYEWKTKELEEEKARTAQVAQELVE